MFGTLICSRCVIYVYRRCVHTQPQKETPIRTLVLSWMNSIDLYWIRSNGIALRRIELTWHELNSTLSIRFVRGCSGYRCQAHLNWIIGKGSLDLDPLDKGHLVRITWLRTLGCDHLAEDPWLRSLGWEPLAETPWLRTLGWDPLAENPWMRSPGWEQCVLLFSIFYESVINGLWQGHPADHTHSYYPT